MFVAGAITGFIISIMSVLAFCFFLRGFLLSSSSEAPPGTFFKRTAKKKPTFVSEEEQWSREQKSAPMDPLYKP